MHRVASQKGSGWASLIDESTYDTVEISVSRRIFPTRYCTKLGAVDSLFIFTTTAET